MTAPEPDQGRRTPTWEGGGETAVERAFTQPAVDRRLPDEVSDPFTALAVVRSETRLDGDPAKNLATFVTTWMEPEARS